MFYFTAREAADKLILASTVLWTNLFTMPYCNESDGCYCCWVPQWLLSISGVIYADSNFSLWSLMKPWNPETLVPILFPKHFMTWPLPAGWLNMPRSHIGLQKPPFWSACGSKTAFLPTFGHIVTLTLDLRTSYCQKCSKTAILTIFVHLVIWWPSLLTPQIFRNA